VHVYGALLTATAFGYSVDSRVELAAAMSHGLPSLASRTTTSNYVGRSNWAADAAFQGVLHELRVYNRALTPAQFAHVAREMCAAWRPDLPR
jgi:hypothetical protein